MQDGLLETVDRARTWLFVPGSRPDRFDRALDSGADVVIVDLEDAVAPEDKDAARDSVRSLLERRRDVAVRINAVGTPEHDADLELLGPVAVPVVLPKAESPPAVRAVVEAVAAHAVLALVESARGVVSAPEIAAVPGVRRLLLGNADLAAQLGVSPDDRQALLMSRSTLVTASAYAGLPAPVDGVTLRVGDLEACTVDARHGRELGFGGKLCIHPAQLDAVRAGYRAAPEELEWARRVLDGGGPGVGTVDGQMVDAPVLARARALLAEADRPTATPTP